MELIWSKFVAVRKFMNFIGFSWNGQSQCPARGSHAQNAPGRISRSPLTAIGYIKAHNIGICECRLNYIESLQIWFEGQLPWERAAWLVIVLHIWLACNASHLTACCIHLAFTLQQSYAGNNAELTCRMIASLDTVGVQNKNIQGQSKFWDYKCEMLSIFS